LFSTIIFILKVSALSEFIEYLPTSSDFGVQAVEKPQAHQFIKKHYFYLIDINGKVFQKK